MREINMESMRVVVDNMLEREKLNHFGASHETLMNYMAQSIGSDKKYCRTFNLAPLPKPKKGLMLFGGTGTGKTTYMRLLRDKLFLQFFNAVDMANAYRNNKNGSFEIIYNDRATLNIDYIIDDLGAENNTSNYGNRDIMQTYLMMRYDYFCKYNVLTHFTSNLSSINDITERYGERFTSRLQEMCYIVEINGKDFRKK